MKSKFFLLVIIAAFSLLHPAFSQERLTNTETASDPVTGKFYEFPRWYPFVNPIALKDSSGIPMGSVAGIAVDKFNTIHLVATKSDGSTDRAYHFENDWRLRRGSGYSSPVLLPDPTGVTTTVASAQDAAAFNSDAHDVWIGTINKGTPPQPVKDLILSQRISGAWSSSQLTNNSVPPDPFGPDTGFIATNVLEAQIFAAPNTVNPANADIHIVYVLEEQQVISQTLHQYTSVICRKPDGNLVTVGPRFDSANGSYLNPRISVDLPTGNPHIVWRLTDPPTTGEKFQYSFNLGVPSDIVTISNGTVRGDVASDLANTPRFAYTLIPNAAPPQNAQVNYKKGTAGTPEQVSTTSGANEVRIQVDTRGQPHIVWTYFVGSLERLVSYASKTSETTWGRHEPIPEVKNMKLNAQTGETQLIDFTGLDAAINQNDGLYMSCFYTNGNVSPPGTSVPLRIPLVTYTTEMNLGDQDAMAMVPAGPNAAANVANGNLTYALPIFSSRGVGFATSLSLVYNSLNPDKTVISPGWMTNYHIFVTDSKALKSPAAPHGGSDTITLHLGDGRSIVFRYNAAKGFHLADDDFGYYSRVETTDVASSTEYMLRTFKMITKFGIEYSFDSNGRLTQIKDTNNNLMTLNYTGGLLTSIVDSTTVRTTGLSYVSNRLDTVTDPAGGTYKLNYDTDNFLSSVTYNMAPVPTVWNFAYHPLVVAGDPVGERRKLIKEIKTPRNNGYSYLWHPDNRVKQEKEPEESSIVDDPNQLPDSTPIVTQATRIFTYTDPTTTPFSKPNEGTNVPKCVFKNRRDFNTTFEYQYKRSLVDKVTDAQQPTAGVLRRFFDGFNLTTGLYGDPRNRNLVRFKDKNLKQTDYSYIEDWYAPGLSTYVDDNLATIKRPLIQTETTNEISYAYLGSGDTGGGLNRVKTVTTARGNVTTYAYNSTGNLTTITYPATGLYGGGTQNASESFVPDGQGRVTSHTAPEGGVTNYVYGDATTGLVTSITRPAHSNPESFSYHPLGQTSTHTLPLGGQSQFLIDGIYRVYEQRDATTEAGQSITKFEYDADSNLTKTTDPENHDTVNAFDKLGRLFTVTNAKIKVMTYHYDREGNTRKAFDFKNPPATGTPSSKTTYDEVNRTKHEYRNGNAAATPNGTNWEHTQLAFDLNGNLTTRTEFGSPNRVTTYTPNERNAIKEVLASDTQTKDQSFFDKDDNVVMGKRLKGAAFLSGTSTDIDERGRARSSAQMLTNFNVGDTTVEGTDTLTTGNRYDKDSNRVKVTDPSQRSTTFVFDLADRQTEVKDNALNTVSKSVHNDNDVRIESWVPDPVSGSLTLVKVATFVPNAKNEIKQIIDAFGKTRSMTFTLNGNVDVQTDELGKQTKFVYDQLNLVKEQHVDYAGANLTTLFGYDDNSNRTSVTDPNTRVYTFLFDTANRMEKLTYPQIGGNPAHTETWTFNIMGEQATHVDANANTTTNTFDVMGRLITEAHAGPNGNVTVTRSYDDAGNLAAIDDGTYKVGYSFDTKRGLLLQVKWFITDFVNPWKIVKYDSTPDDGKVDDGYDSSANRKKMITPESETVDYFYSADNRLTDIYRNSVLFAHYVYDVAGRRKEIDFGNSSKMLYTFDANERLKTIKCQKSDGSSLLSLVYNYNDRGERTRIDHEHYNTFANYSYNNQGWLTGEYFWGNIQNQSFTNTFTSGGGNESTTYSPVACVTPQAVTSIAPYFGVWNYDLNGNRTFKCSLNEHSTYSYNEENQLTTENPSVHTKVSGTVSASDTEVGYSVSVVNDSITTDSTATGNTWKSQNTSAQHWVQLSFTDDVGNPLTATVAYVRLYIPTAPGNVQKFKIQYLHSDGVTWIDAVVAGMIWGSPNASWNKMEAHDIIISMPNTTTKAIRYLQDVGGGSSTQPNVAYMNEIEAYAPSGLQSISNSYDANGSLTTKTQGSTSESYGYNYMNRMNSYVKTVGGVTQQNWAYVFAPTGHRISKQNLTTTVKDWYLNDGEDVIADYTQTGGGAYNYVRSYVNSLGIDDKIARIESGASTYYVPDSLGTPQLSLDSTQSVTHRLLNTAWGETAFETGTNERYGFTQRENDSESNLEFYRARMYDNRIGKFTQSDPINMGASGKRFGYVVNSPLSNKDPSGMYIQVSESMNSDFVKKVTENFIWAPYFKLTTRIGTDLVYGADANWAVFKQGPGDLTGEILWRMLISPRQFKFNSIDDLTKDMTIRNRIVQTARSIQFGFGAENPPPNAMKLKWCWGAFEGDSPSAAINPWFDPTDPDLATYRTGCIAGKNLVVLKGVLDSLGQNPQAAATEFDRIFKGYNSIEDMFSGKGLSGGKAYKSDTGVLSGSDWVPGDYGYVKNHGPVLPGETGHEGENIIYLGGTYRTGASFGDEKVFWGLYGRGATMNSLRGWLREVGSWNNNAGAALEPWRWKLDVSELK